MATQQHLLLLLLLPLGLQEQLQWQAKVLCCRALQHSLLAAFAKLQGRVMSAARCAARLLLAVVLQLQQLVYVLLLVLPMAALLVLQCQSDWFMLQL
jgi:hypothetical protein